LCNATHEKKRRMELEIYDRLKRLSRYICTSSKKKNDSIMFPDPDYKSYLTGGSKLQLNIWATKTSP
jgi:hypothetical protein